MTRILQRFCDIVDLVAGFLLGVVTLLIVASTVARYFFAYAIPDAFDLSRYLIGACLMWGYASIGLRGGHIAVDAFWEISGARARKVIDFIAWALLLFFTVLLTYQMFFRLRSAYLSNEATFDLRLPAWPFIALIWVGCAVSIVTITASVILNRKQIPLEEAAEEQGL